MLSHHTLYALRVNDRQSAEADGGVEATYSLQTGCVGARRTALMHGHGILWMWTKRCYTDTDLLWDAARHRG